MKRLFIHAGDEFQFQRACTCIAYEKWQADFIVREDDRKRCREISGEVGITADIEPLGFDENGIDFDKRLVSLIKKNDYENVYLIAPKSTTVRFLENVHHLNMGPFYSICRALHRMGIKDISFFNSNQILHRRIDHLLDDFTGYGEGKRCFIVGNGPSLNRIDMKLLRDEVTFGCNRGYLGFNQWEFEFDFWAVIDRIQIEHHFLEWETSIPEKTIKLFPFEYCSLFNLRNVCPVNFVYDAKPFPSFSSDPGMVALGFTTVHFLMQIAVIMGFKEIILVGVDNRYEIPKEMVENDRWTDTHSRNHFHHDYGEQGKRIFVPPRMEKSNTAFDHAAVYCSKNGIKVKNATPGSALTCFPFSEFSELLS